MPPCDTCHNAFLMPGPCWTHTQGQGCRGDVMGTVTLGVGRPPGDELIAQSLTRLRQSRRGGEIIARLEAEHITITALSDEEYQQVSPPNSDAWAPPFLHTLVVRESALGDADAGAQVLAHEGRHALDYAGLA